MLKQNKMVLTVFSVLILMVSLFSGLSISEDMEYGEETIVLVDGIEDDVRTSLRNFGEVVDHYGDFALMRVPIRDLEDLKEEFDVNRLEHRNELNVKGHEFDTQEGSPEFSSDLTIECYGPETEGLYIVDMMGPVNPEWRSTLEEKGVEIINYVPNYAYEVIMTPELADRIEALDFVDWVGVYQPGFKLAEDLRPGLVSVSTVDGGREIIDVRDESIFVDMARDPEVYYIANYEEPGLQGEIATQIIGGGCWILDPDDDPDNPFRLDNGEPPYGGNAGSLMNQIGYTGEGVTIAVADSGIGDGTTGDSGVEDFTGRVVGGYSFGGGGWGDDNTPGHGTHCASQAAGDGYHGTGTTLDEEEMGDYYLGQGSAPGSELFSVKTLDSRGSWMGPSDTFELVEVASQGSDSYIHTNSWGARHTYGGYPEESSSFDEAVRDSNRDTDHNEEMVITVAVGNDGPSFNNVEPPSTGKNVIGVGSNENFMPLDDLGVTPSDNPESVSEFSSRGWTDDNRVKPDLVAPGENVFLRASPADDHTYYVQQGTSFANPALAGAAAVVIEWFEEEHGYRPSPAMVKGMLINTAHHLNEDEGNTGPIPNRMEGWGMVHIPDLIDTELGFEFRDQERTLTTGETSEYEIEVGDISEPLKVSLTWTDKEAEPGDSITLKNDLNLELISPSGEKYRGNAFPTDQDGFSTSNYVEVGAPAMEFFDGSGDGWDDRNNVQNVYIHPDDLEDGTYTVNVIGENVPEDGNNDDEASQDYALVMNNVLDDEIPSIELERPQGGEMWTAGDEEEIRWSTEEGDAPISGIDIEYSTDDGSSWIDIETGTADTGMYEWTIPHESTEEALVQVTVHDDNELSHTDVSDPFTIMGEPPEPPADLQVEHYSLESGLIYEDDVSEDKGYTTEIWSQGENDLFETTSIAVVDEDNAQGDAIVDRLSELPYTFTVLESDELIDEMSNHDHFLVQRFGSDDLSEDFLNELEDDQGVVYLDSGWADDGDESYADGIFRLHNIRNDPEERSEVGLEGEGLELHIEEDSGDHPIFDGVGGSGDIVDIYTGDWIRGSWYEDYSGSTLGQVNYIDSNTGGDGVGVSDDGTEVLLPALNIGYQADAENEGWTEEADRLLMNSVEFVVEMGETESEWDIREHDSTIGESSWDFGDTEYIKAGQAYESRLISPEIDIPEDGQDVKLYFDHWCDLYEDHDGGNLKVSTDGIEGDFTLIEPEEGYDGTISGTNNPLEGEQGWYGQTDWRGVTFDLTDYAGESIHLRWNAGIDEEEVEGKEGWRIDDISIIDEGDEGDEDNLLTWEASLDDPDTVEEYNIYRSEDAGGPYEKVAALNAEGFEEYDYVDEGKGTGDEILWWYKVYSEDAFGREIGTEPVREPGDELEVVLTRPEGGETWFIGEEEEIRWSSAPGDHDIESVDLEYNIDGGSWQTIEEGLDDTGSFDWDVVDEITEEAQIRITVHDEDGDSDSDTSGVFTITESRVLEIDVKGEGSTVPPEGIHHYELGEEVVVKAIPDVGHYFEEWTGDYTGTEDEMTLIMDEDKEITAWFEAHEYELDVTTVGEGDVEIDPEQDSYHHGTEVTLTAEPKEGWYFEEWTGDHIGTQEEVTITMDDDKEITAHFDEADPAHFEVEINSPDEGEDFYEGETIRVDYRVENTGDLQGTQDITFLVEGVEEDVLSDLILDGGQVHTDDFTWKADDLGDHGLEVTSEDTDDSVTISVEEQPDDPYFSVNIFDHDEEVTVGEEVTVDYRVTNVGKQEGTQDIVISVDDQEVERREDIDLGPGEEYDDEVTIDLETEGEYNIDVASDDDSDSVITSVVPLTYDLTIDIIGEGTVEVDPDQDGYEEGTEVTLTAIPYEGHEFVEWTGYYEGTEYEITIEMDEDKEVTAVFEEDVEYYELTVNIEGEGTVEIEPDQDEYEEGTEVELTAVPEEGHVFVEWTGDAERTEEEITITMDGNKEITAHFDTDLDTYDLTIDVEGEGSTNPEEGTHTYEEGAEVTVTATSDAGWYFDGWTGDHEGTEEEITITMVDDKEVTAVFEEDVEYYELTLDVEGEGEVNIDPYQEEYEEGTEVELTAVPEKGHVFVEWTGDAEGTEEEITITMDGNKEITAVFEEEEYHELTVNVEGEGEVEIEPDQDEYEEGTEVELTASPEEDWVFLEWIGDKTSTDTTIQVTMDSDKSITAHFEELGEAYFEVSIVSPEDGEEFEKGEEIVVDYEVMNTGAVTGEQDIEFYVGGELVDTEEGVEIEPDGTYEGQFTWEVEEDGAVELEVHSSDEGEVDSISLTISSMDDPEDDDFPWWLILVVLIVVALVAVIFFVTTTKSEEDEEANEKVDEDDEPADIPMSSTEKKTFVHPAKKRKNRK